MNTLGTPDGDGTYTCTGVSDTGTLNGAPTQLHSHPGAVSSSRRRTRGRSPARSSPRLR
jgi:hypothetical protein